MRTVLAMVTLATASCSGPCKRIATERQALLARSDRAPGAHARIQVPFALANPLLAEAVRDQPEIPLQLDRLGPLAAYVPRVRALVRAVELAPAPPGKVGFAVRVAVLDDTGELLELRGRGDATPVLANNALSIGIRADQLARLVPELGPRAAASVGAELAKRLPAAVRGQVPQFVIDRVAAAAVEEMADLAYRGLRGAAL